MFRLINIFKSKKDSKPFIPSRPLMWWIDDLTHEVCGLIDDPKRGLHNMPWPDNEKVYVAIDYTEYQKLEAKIKLQDQRIENLLKAVNFYGEAGNWSHASREPVFLGVDIEVKAYAFAREAIARDKELIKESKYASN
jgi:hypothetical protein